MIKTIFKLILGFTLLLAIQYAANSIVHFMDIKFPAPLLGMILLALMIQFKIIKIEWVEDICDLLLKNMPLFFIPLFVGVISYAAIIKQNILPIIVTVIITTFTTMAISAMIVEKIILAIAQRRDK